MAFRFTNKRSLPFRYRLAFLRYTQHHAPEVLESLKELVPNFDAYAGGSGKVFSISAASLPLTHQDLAADDKIRGRLVDLYLLGIDDPAILVPSAASCDRNKSTYAKPEKESGALRTLRDSFEAFIQQYGLSPDWLRFEMLRLLSWLVHDLDHNTLTSAHTGSYRPARGEVVHLQIDPWLIDESWEEFETRSNEKFAAEISRYKVETIQHFRESGYKRTTKPLSFDSVEWVVLWTVKQWPKSKILDFICRQRPSTMTEDQLNEVFRRLAKEYDLPVRRIRPCKSLF